MPRLHVAILSFLALLTVAWVIFLAWGVFKIFRIALSGKPVDDECNGDRRRENQRWGAPVM